MIDSCVWQLVPGTSEVYLYSILRKPSIESSNSFIFKAPGGVLILDPGGDPKQVEHIEEVVQPMLMEHDMPVRICLTHAHMDHFHAMSRLLGKPLNGQLTCHLESAEILRSGDDHRSLAYMYGIEVPSFNVSTKVFESARQPRAKAAGPAHGPGEQPGVCHARGVPGTPGLPREFLKLGERDSIEIFHTPGHAEDSLTFKVGEFLFVGDLPFAAEPAVAGIPGWDPESLRASIDGLTRILANGSISLVVPSHGSPWPVSKARKIFSGISLKVYGLSELAVLDENRVDHLLHYSEVLLEEAARIFSIISGTLLKVFYYLEELEEEGGADEVVQLLALDRVDAIIHEFHSFLEEIRGSRLKGLILLRAIRFAESLRSTFQPEQIGYLLSPSLLRRTISLFTDFINSVYGMSFDHQEVVFNPGDALNRILSSLKESPFDDRALFNAAEDHEAFVRELSCRLAHNALFRDVSFAVFFEPEEIWVNMEPGAFEDLLTSLLEELAASGFTRLELHCENGQEGVLLRVKPRGERSPDISGKREEYFGLSMARHGGGFRKELEQGKTCYVFQLRAAEGPIAVCSGPDSAHRGGADGVQAPRLVT